MTALVKAKIIPLDGNGNPHRDLEAFEVQFNPATLRLQVAAPASGGGQRSQPRRQHPSPATTTLTLELSFDTYDEGTTESPVPVSKKTALLEQFLKPVKAGVGGPEAAPPPRIRFSWGNISVDGVVKTLSIDYEHFHPGGAPLRAKCSLTMESQDPLDAAPEASVSRATRPGEVAGVAPAPTAASPAGSIPAPPADRVAPAQDDESLAAFAARNGLDPKGWRNLAAGIGDALSLPAGLEIGFSTRLGGGAATGSDLSPTAQRAAALTAAGGPAAAAARGKTASNERAVDQQRAAFAAPRPPRTATGSAASVPAGSSAASERASALDVATRLEQRPYGIGLPLRPTVAVNRDAVPPTRWARSSSREHARGCGCGCGS